MAKDLETPTGKSDDKLDGVKSNSLESQLAKASDKLSDGAKLSLVICANAFRFGGNWGFIRADKPDFRYQLELLKQEHPNVKAKQLSNGALILANENFLAVSVNTAVPDAINGNFVQMATIRRQKERESFQKFLKGVAKGTSRFVKNASSNYYELVIGLFSVNDVNEIRIGGKEYPAFNLTLIEALEYAYQLTNVGFKVYAKAITADGKAVFDEVFNLATNSKGVDALYRGMEIADSDTGVFLTMRLLMQ